MRGRIRHKLRASIPHKDRRHEVMEEILQQEMEDEREEYFTDECSRCGRTVPPSKILEHDETCDPDAA